MENQTVPAGMSMRTRTLVVILVVIVVAVLTLLIVARVLRLSSKTPAPAERVTAQQAFSDVFSSNDTFKQGMDAYTSGDMALATSKFDQALTITTEPALRATINLYLALALRDTGNYERAIAIYQGIAADSSNYSARLRAEAIQEMGLMYYKYLDPRITTAVFAAAPYQALYTEGKDGLSYRKLFEYATSIYPIATSELRAANWYANQLLDPSATLKANAAQQTKYKSTILSDLAAADSDLASMTSDTTRTAPYLSAVLSRANLIAKMALMGESAAGNPENEYKKLIDIYAAKNLAAQDGIARIYYTGYLAQAFGKTRSADIRTILAPLSDTSRADTAAVKQFLATNKQNEGSVGPMLITIASIDPIFKAQMVSSGWTDADLK